MTILTAALVGLFMLGAFLYVRFYVSPQAHGVILFIAPATNVSQLAELEDSVLSRSDLNASLLTEPFHHAEQHFSYLSTGIPSTEDRVGVDSAGGTLDNLFYKAQRSGRRIGIVTTTAFTHPAAAAFYRHALDAASPADIAPQLFDSTTINVMLGGNPAELTRYPERNLVSEAEARGYRVIQSPQEVAEIPRWRTRLLLGVFDYPDDLFDPESHATSPSLSEMVILAIQCLQFHIGGYFLVVVHPDPAEIEYAGELPEEFQRAHAFQLNAALQSACDYTGDTGTVLLYAPQPNSTSWLVRVKGTSAQEGILTLKKLHDSIQQIF